MEKTTCDMHNNLCVHQVKGSVPSAPEGDPTAKEERHTRRSSGNWWQRYGSVLVIASLSIVLLWFLWKWLL